eukprot:TRINITY_DN11610_c0_g1_i1.p1 TRINITY_DN11610_c0_g1~~TRINITY_DN11610_c0_g1_i1.p1  ORF type:complete len:512 (-),score=61.81 TRINITY_DN11610_c0_g1_i1:364-1800(-)
MTAVSLAPRFQRALHRFSLATLSASDCGARHKSTLSETGNNSKSLPRWGIVSVPEGERFGMWDRRSGAYSQVVGPQQVWCFGSRMQPLGLHLASPDQYLKLSFKDGSVKYLAGPTHVWEDPLHVSKIEVLPSLQVGSKEAIVVYREMEGDGDQKEIRRFILHGPMLYSPTNLEWVHRFEWHGTERASLSQPIQRKLPGLLTFQKIRLTPDQLYLDTPGVRTRDDALLTMKVMLFLELIDVEQMLDTTHDPISEFMNALSADCIDFASSRSFDCFKADSEALNSIESYPNLVSRATGAGYKITGVVFRGYLASEQLQEMHDQAIQKRTKLVLEKESQVQEHDLKDFKLKRDSERAERLADFGLQRARQRQELQKEQTRHKEAIVDLRARSELERDRVKQQHRLLAEDESRAQSLRHQQQSNTANMDYYSALRNLGVDLSKYLTVVARGAPHRVIEVDCTSTGGSIPTQLHLHSEDTEKH